MREPAVAARAAPRTTSTRSSSGAAGATGCPSCAPTPARVRRDAGRGQGRSRARRSGLMPPLWRECTLEKLAVNAVMAGAEPAYFPVIVAAAQAVLDPAFNLYGVQATTHPVAPLVDRHRPVRAGRSGMHAGSGLFGPGFRANATIGRAIRLVLLNVGGAGRDGMTWRRRAARRSSPSPSPSARSGSPVGAAVTWRSASPPSRAWSPCTAASRPTT